MLESNKEEKALEKEQCEMSSTASFAARRESTCTTYRSSQFKNNYFAEMCSGSEAGPYLRLIDF